MDENGGVAQNQQLDDAVPQQTPPSAPPMPPAVEALQAPPVPDALFAAPPVAEPVQQNNEPLVPPMPIVEPAQPASPTETPDATFDVMSIGDIGTDAFIKLLDDEAKVIEDDKGKELVIPFATKVPYDHVQVIEGVYNAPNAAVSFARLGLKTAMVSNVGGDQPGRDIINAQHKNGVDTRFIHINPDKKSNYHYVLWYKEERTILIKHEAYDYHWPPIRPNELPRWVYFSSISANAIPYHDQISDWLEQNPSVKMAFQPGTFQMEAGVERLKRIYQHTEVLLLNREEAVTVGGGNHDDINDLFAKLHVLGPKIVVITDGPKGAFASDGQNKFKMPVYPDPAPPFERTGAGDAFSSTFVAALAKGNTIEGALQWAPINSMSVVQKVGGQEGLLTEAQLEDWLRKAPANYRPEKM